MKKIFILIVLSAGNLASTEIDSFTLRDPYMQDSLQELNQIVQVYFDKAKLEAHKERSCDKKVIETALHQQTSGVLWAKIEGDIDDSATLDRRTLARKASIYRDVTLLEGTVLHMVRLGFLMRTGEFFIGSDKFGHFFTTGYEYHQKSSLPVALAFGAMTERTYYGLMTTAVFSYADLVANLEGYYFWRLVAGGDNPYFSCNANLWTQRRRFDWSDYIGAAWDEAHNCNYYKNAHVTRAVQKRIAALGFTCPVTKKHCADMIDRYGDLARQVVSEECFN